MKISHIILHFSSFFCSIRCDLTVFQEFWKPYMGMNILTSIYVLAKVSEIFAQILFSTQLILDYCEVSESAALVFWRQHCTISELS